MAAYCKAGLFLPILVNHLSKFSWPLNGYLYFQYSSSYHEMVWSLPWNGFRYRSLTKNYFGARQLPIQGKWLGYEVIWGSHKVLYRSCKMYAMFLLNLKTFQKGRGNVFVFEKSESLNACVVIISPWFKLLCSAKNRIVLRISIVSTPGDSPRGLGST